MASAGRSVVRLVLDTNVVLSAKLWGGKSLLPLSARREYGLNFFTSEALIEELKSVLTRSHMQKRLLDARLDLSGVVAAYRKATQIINPLQVGQRFQQTPTTMSCLGRRKPRMPT